MEQKTPGSQPVRLSRIVVPANVRIVPVEDVADSAAQDVVANSSVPPKVEPVPPPEQSDAEADKLDADKDKDEGAGNVKRLAVVAFGLAVTIGVLLFTYSQSGPQATATTSTPEAEPPSPGDGTAVASASLATEGLAASPPQVGPEAVIDTMRTPAPSPTPVPQPRPDPAPTPSPEVASVEPILVDAVQPTAALLPNPPEALATMPRPRPVVSVAPPAPPAEPTAPAILDVAVAPPELTRPPAVVGDGLLDRFTYGTVAALRRTDDAVPTAAESAVLGFVRSLQRDDRSASDIAAMLQRAHDANSMRVPDKFLLPDGGVDISAILTTLEAQQ